MLFTELAVQNRETFTKGTLGKCLQVNTVRMVTGVWLSPPKKKPQKLNIQ